MCVGQRVWLSGATLRVCIALPQSSSQLVQLALSHRGSFSKVPDCVMVPAWTSLTGQGRAVASEQALYNAGCVVAFNESAVVDQTVFHKYARALASRATEGGRQRAVILFDHAKGHRDQDFSNHNVIPIVIPKSCTSWLQAPWVTTIQPACCLYPHGRCWTQRTSPHSRRSTQYSATSTCWPTPSTTQHRASGS